MLKIAGRKNITIEGKVISFPKHHESYQSFFLVSEKISNLELKLKIKCMNYTSNSDILKGDFIKVICDLSQSRIYKNPSVYDYSTYLANKKTFFIATIKEISIIRRSKQVKFQQLILSIRNYIAETIKKNLSEENSSIILKMFIGDEEALKREVKDVFSDAGVMHVLVVSGLHVGYVLAFVLFISRIFLIPKNIAFLITIPTVLLYAHVTGLNPPVVRATITSITGIICFLLTREKSVYHALVLSAFLILLFDPVSIFTPSFQLSFSAYFGIIYLYKKLNKFIPKSFPLSIITGILFLSLSAQLFVAPWVAYYFNKVSLIAVVANLLVVPLVGFILYFVFTMCLFGFLPKIANIISKFVDILVSLLNDVTHFFANLPCAVVRVPTPSILFIFYYYCLLISLLSKNRKKYIYILLLFTIVILGIESYKLITQKNKLSIKFIDVGHGDSILLTTPKNKHLLIDCGGSYAYDIGRGILSPYLNYSKITTIQKLFITHLHFAHYFGAPEIVKQFKIKEIYIPPTIINEYEFKALLNEIKNKKIKYSIIKFGEEFNLDGIEIKVLNPTKITMNLDEDALVLLVRYKRIKILLTSDIKPLNRIRDMVENVDIVQLPSHGKYLLDIPFLSSLNPKYIVISTDEIPNEIDNELKRLKNAMVISTSKHGLIEFLTDGENIKLKKYLH